MMFERKSPSTEGNRVRMNPIVDVRVLRARWGMTLALAIAAGWLIVERFAFSAGTASALAFATGIGVTAAGALMLLARARAAADKQMIAAGGLRVAAWDALALAVTVLGAWQIIETLVFSLGASLWITFGDACLLLGMALAGLTLHELSTERVVHSLEIVGERER